MLTAENLTVRRGHIRALDSISFAVGVGEVVVVLGANGAGKSTLLGTTAGLYPPAGGRLHLDERLMNGLSPEAIVRRGISLVPENRELFPALSVRDNLMLGAFHRHRTARKDLKADLTRILVLFPALHEKLGQPARTLSGGLQQMVAIGRALMAGPRLLLMDEPSIGLAPLVVQEIMLTVRRLKEQGQTIILVEQNARAALRVADRVLVLERGRITFTGTPDEVKRAGRLQSAYLGRAAGESS